MDWPSIEDYRSALQNPGQVFRDTCLQACTPERNKMGLPRGRAGGYAIVYRLSSGSASTAVRVFLHRPRPDRERRYQMVHAYLQQARPRCLIDFGYDHEGITIGAQHFPTLTMEWVEGPQLGEWLRNAVTRGDTRAIKAMADYWIELVGELREHQIAHGDLQHGNILVVGDRPMLVDYDCMYVPTMVADADREAWEFGLPGYQHPDRVGKLLGPQFDDFSAWSILIALKTAADDPDLWRKYVVETDVENVLFTRDDIEAPDRSQLWLDLISSAKDRKVREWAANLRASLDGPFASIPPFEIDIFGPLRAVIAAGDWSEIQSLASSAKYAAKSFPPDLAPVVQEAAMRVECLEQLQAKARLGRVREFAAAYRPALVDDWADPTLVAQARAAAAAVALLDEFAELARTEPDDCRLAELWDQRGDELRSLPEAEEFQKRATSWQLRNAALHRLEHAVIKGDDTAIAEAWLALANAGGDMRGEVYRERAEAAVRRIDALRKLASLSDREDEPSDHALLTVWRNVEHVIESCPEFATYQARVGNALHRQSLVALLRKAVAAADRGRCAECDVAAAAAGLPPAYSPTLTARVELARNRTAASAALERALHADPISDLAIAAAADRVREFACWPKDPEINGRCILALSRRDALKALAAIPGSLPLDQRDAQWCALWRGDLLDHCNDALEQRTTYLNAVARIAAANELTSALANRDAATVKRLSRDPILHEHPALERCRAEIEELITTSERIDRMLAALEGGRAADFFADADPAFLTRHAGVFQPYNARIEQWVGSWLATTGALRAADPPFLPHPSEGAVIARWVWGQQRLVRHCLLATDSTRFLEKPEDSVDQTHKVHPDAHRRELSGSTVLIPAGARHVFISIWPIVDLGWTRLPGPPLHLGPFDTQRPTHVPAPRTRTEPQSRGKQIRRWLEQLLNNV